jgi:hypothetical protein
MDLARDKAGAWTGSLTIPGLDIKGAPLGHFKLEGTEISFDAGSALGIATDDGARFKARFDAATMTGDMTQAGNTARFTLTRTGSAQVDAVERSRPVASTTQGKWIGEFELGGYPRHVTLDIANDGDAAPKVEFVVVGKMTTKLPIDFAAEEEGILRIESRPYRLTFEARVAPDRLEGTLEQGFLEVPIVLHRATEKTS